MKIFNDCLPRVGRGFFVKEFYSICSAHRGPVRPSHCLACQTGQWVNVWKRAAGAIVYRTMPGVWIWWVNRPNSNERRFLRSVFPNLR